ncbi:MAG: GFA family protein [Primorskyibacter sp.]
MPDRAASDLVMVPSHADVTGGCLCGAVRFVARDVAAKTGICHCPQCQKWTGGALVEVSVPEPQVDWQGETIALYASSDWAERAFCSRCGSGLYFRMTDANSDWAGAYDIPLGLFDNPTAFTLSHEIYSDHAIVPIADQGQARLTRADCVAKFPKLDEG